MDLRQEKKKKISERVSSVEGSPVKLKESMVLLEEERLSPAGIGKLLNRKYFDFGKRYEDVKEYFRRSEIKKSDLMRETLEFKARYN